MEIHRARTDDPLWEQALPVRWWKEVLEGRRLRLRLEGDGAATVWGSHGGRRDFRLEGSWSKEFTRITDDWLWVEGEGVESIVWSVDGIDGEVPQVVAVVPTFKREPDACAQAERFAAMEVVDRVFVVDQGGSLSSHEPFAELIAASPKVRLLTQPNLGGSGGYARGMLESMETGGHAVFLSDDDAQITEESLRRMVTYQALAPRPTIIGTGMFSTEEPTLLISHSEGVRSRSFMWGPVDRVRSPINVKGTTPRDWGFLRPRRDINYTGWWGTLLPPGAVRELGLPAAYFLKWDDAEYGLRATRAGYRHVVLPGASVTHPTWGAHKTQMTWTARILHRNRLASAAASNAGRGVIISSLAHQIKHIISGHHLTATLWSAGIDEFLAGPEWLGDDLIHAREAGQRIVDEWVRSSLTELTGTRTRPLPRLRGAARALARMLRRAGSTPRVVLTLPAHELSWRATLGADGVILTEGGVAVDTLVADPQVARALLRSTLTQHWALLKQWRSLRHLYRGALANTVTPSAWERIIDDAKTETDGGA